MRTSDGVLGGVVIVFFLRCVLNMRRYRDYSVDLVLRKEVNSLIKRHYKGYHFVSHDSEALYNPVDLMYFLNELIRLGTIPKPTPEQTNLSWLKRIFDQDKTQALLNQLQRHNKVAYDYAARKRVEFAYG